MLTLFGVTVVLYCIVLYCIVLYCIVSCRVVLYCIVLYCIVSYRIVLYCIVLYCNIPYPNITYPNLRQIFSNEVSRIELLSPGTNFQVKILKITTIFQFCRLNGNYLIHLYQFIVNSYILFVLLYYCCKHTAL